MPGTKSKTHLVKSVFKGQDGMFLAVKKFNEVLPLGVTFSNFLHFKSDQEFSREKWTETVKAFTP